MTRGMGCMVKIILALLFLPAIVIYAALAGSLKLPNGHTDGR